MLDNSSCDKILLFSASSVAWFRWWGAIEPKFIHRSIAWHCWTSGAARNPLCIKGMPTRHKLRIQRRARFLSNFSALYNSCCNAVYATSQLPSLTALCNNEPQYFYTKKCPNLYHTMSSYYFLIVDMFEQFFPPLAPSRT